MRIRVVAPDGGIGIGSTEAEVKSTYPSVKVTPHEYLQGGHYLTYTSPNEPNKAVLWETDGTKVTTMRSGRADFVGYVEGCS